MWLVCRWLPCTRLVVPQSPPLTGHCWQCPMIWGFELVSLCVYVVILEHEGRLLKLRRHCNCSWHIHDLYVVEGTCSQVRSASPGMSLKNCRNSVLCSAVYNPALFRDFIYLGVVATGIQSQALCILLGEEREWHPVTFS